MLPEIAVGIAVAEKVVKTANDIKKSQMGKMPDEIDELDILEKGLSVASITTGGEKLSAGEARITEEERKYPKEIGELDNTMNKGEINDLPDEIEIEDINTPESQIDSLENTNESLNENEELEEKKGGSYRDVKKTSDGETHEVHHMPADSASHLERDDGPAIKMEKEDHRQTASCGSSREAREYRAAQKELIDQGKFREALQMDIDDIHDKFGDKYDDAIAEMLEYVDKLEAEGKISG